MEISATLMGLFVFLWMLISTIIVFFIARRKTNTPILAAFINTLLSLLPLLSLIFMIVLILKDDLTAKKAEESQND
ncbi:MAG: hypothetical protein AAGB12_16115 [Pseudomonadota bacterium]